jgi:sulfatase-like protein
METAAEAPVIPSSTVAERPHKVLGRDWRRLTQVSALSTALLDVALLQRKHALFTGGFLAPSPMGTAADAVAFFLALVFLNATLIGPVCGLTLLIAHRCGLRPAAARFAALSAGVLPLAVADFLSYQVWSYLGDAFDVGIVFDLTGRRLSELFAVAAPLMARPAAVGLLAIVGVAAATGLLQRARPRSTEPLILPSLSALLFMTVVMFLCSAALLIMLVTTSDSMDFGLRWTPAGQVLGRVLNGLTDFDRDGYGLLRAPRDPAVFDKAIHPYALEIPGNGIDEDGIAGDLPRDRASYLEPPPPTARWRTRPAVLLFVLESFRADVVGAAYDGRPVTPVMDALASGGLRLDSAWSHNGFTAQSRFHILSGSLANGRHGTTLLDDFKNHGYEVGYFSGQDDSFGNMGINYGRVDHYYDARMEPEKRYTAHATPGSLAVPMAVLEQHIGAFLDARSDQTVPLFLYVNFHDTHFPYSHADVENLLGVNILDASLIAPSRRRDLWRTYLNTAANVDRAIGRVIAEVSARVGQQPAVVITSDHGESLFDGGFLGHGYALTDSQTRVPLIVSRLPMKLHAPFGQAELRDGIADALASSDAANDARPLIEQRSQARVFQYIGTLDHPGEIGWRSPSGQVTYDFRSDRFQFWDVSVRPQMLTGVPLQMFRELVYQWEGIRLARAQQTAGGR